MGFGHLDYETGKWIDDPEEEHTVKIDDDYVTDRVLPAANPEAPPIPNGPQDATGPGAPPLSIADKARLVRKIHSGQGSPAEIESARQLLARNR